MLFGWGVEIGRCEGTVLLAKSFWTSVTESIKKKQKGGFYYWQKQGSKGGNLSLETEYVLKYTGSKDVLNLLKK